MSLYRIGIIGFGAMAQTLASRLTASGHFNVAAVWDPGPQAQAAIARLPGAIPCDSASAVCAIPDVDLVYIASPPASHLDYIALAAAAGKAVLCEKPLATDVAAAAALAARARDEGWRVAVNFVFAASPPVARLARLLREGAIGQLSQVDVHLRFRQWPRPGQAQAGWLTRRAEGGFSREVLSHFLFLLVRELGAPRILEHTVSYPDDPLAAETALAARLQIGHTPVGIDAAIGGEIDDDNRCTFVGTTGCLRLHDWYCLQRSSGGEWHPIADLGREDAYGQTRTALLEQLQAFAGGKTHTLATLDEAWQVQHTVEALLREAPQQR
jgi:predicted dehydrogenase